MVVERYEDQEFKRICIGSRIGSNIKYSTLFHLNYGNGNIAPYTCFEISNVSLNLNVISISLSKIIKDWVETLKINESERHYYE